MARIKFVNSLLLIPLQTTVFVLDKPDNRLFLVCQYTAILFLTPCYNFAIKSIVNCASALYQIEKPSLQGSMTLCIILLAPFNSSIQLGLLFLDIRSSNYCFSMCVRSSFGWCHSKLQLEKTSHPHFDEKH